MMNQGIRTQWADALRSGDYAQATGVLTRVSGVNGKKSHCCLGVLCELAVAAGVLTRDDEKINMFDTKDDVAASAIGYDGQISYLPSSVVEWAGLDEDNPTITGEYNGHTSYHYLKLASINDGGAPFSEIADLIEKHL